MPGPRFGFVKLLASSGSHCTKWANEQHRPAGFESQLVPDLPLPQFCQVCLGTGDFLRPQEATPPGFYPLWGGYCQAPQKEECRRGRRYFWPCRTRVGFGPATGPTLKTALCHIRALVGRIDKYQRSTRTLSRAGSLRSSYEEKNPTLFVVAFASPPLLVVDSTPFFYGIF